MKLVASLVLYKHEYSEVEKTIDALLLESDIDQLVIVDNGSLCNWLANFQHSKVVVIRTPVNLGFGAAHNIVFEKYKDLAEYFLICNPDIYFEKDEINKAYSFCKENNVDLSIPRVLYPDGTMQYGAKLLPSPYHLFARRFRLFTSASESNSQYELRFADYTKPFFAPSLSGCCLIVSSRAVSQTGGFDPTFFLYLEDVDFSRRICELGLNVLYCPYSFVYHESQRKSYKNFRFLIMHIQSAIKYFNKWGWICDKNRTMFNKKCIRALPDKKPVH